MMMELILMVFCIPVIIDITEDIFDGERHDC